MRRIYAVSALLFCATSLTSAEMWTGQLFDANCVRQHRENQKFEGCTPAERTASFMLQTAERMLKLDVAGDRKAAAAWQEYMNSADRDVNPAAKCRALSAVIQGTVIGDLIKVDRILLR